jgi:MFS family permease
VEKSSLKPTAASNIRKTFYGWIALSGAVLALLVCGGAFTNSFGVFLPVFSAEFGWSRATIAFALSLGTLAFGLPSPLWGLSVAKFGPRINIIVGDAIAAFALAGLSLVHEVWQLYLLFILIGLGAGLGGYIAVTTVANNWFARKVSIAMAMTAAGGGLSGFIFPPVATLLISSIGWRMTWLVLAGMVLIGASLIGGVVMVRNRPEDIGQVPDGLADEHFAEKGIAETRSVITEKPVSMPLKELVKMPASWFIALFGVANAFVISTMSTHQVAYLQDIGFSPIVAATTLSVWSISSIVFSMVFGSLALRFNIRYLAGAAILTQLMALALLLITKELALLYVYSVLLGAGIGALVAALPTFVGAYYGRALYSRVIGFVFSFHVIGLAFAGYLAGAIYDATHSYVLDFVIVIVFCLMGLISVYLVRKPKLSR